MSNTPIADLNAALDLGEEPGAICGGGRVVVDAGAFDHTDGLEIVRRWNIHPEMLESLHELVAGLYAVGITMPAIRVATQEALDRAKAVIAKAENS
jgi:hypothetical protein